jgi:hypothetical protein
MDQHSTTEPHMRIDFYQSLGIVCGALLAVLTLLGLIGKQVILPMIRAIRRMNEVADELLGEPARDGRPARPSLMARVTGIEDRLSEHIRSHEPPPVTRPVLPNGSRRR